MKGSMASQKARGPGQVLLRILRVRPNRENQEIVGVPAMCERRICRTNARSGSVQVLSREPDKCPPRGSLRSEVHKDFDGIVADGLEEVRFPIVQLAWREETVEHRLLGGNKARGLSQEKQNWCRRPESNWLRPPFQGGALPLCYPGTVSNSRDAHCACQIIVLRRSTVSLHAALFCVLIDLRAPAGRESAATPARTGRTRASSCDFSILRVASCLRAVLRCRLFP